MKNLFVLNFDNAIDIITNSSSELFVFKEKSKSIVNKLIKSIYPDYLSEYEEVVHISEASNENIDIYFSWCTKYSFNEEKDLLELANKLNSTPEILYSNWEERFTEKYWYAELSNKAFNIIREQYKNSKIYLLFSIDENPNWDYQEKLSRVATRYHLG